MNFTALSHPGLSPGLSQVFVSRPEMTHKLSVISNLPVHDRVVLGLGQGGALKDTLLILP